MVLLFRGYVFRPSMGKKWLLLLSQSTQSLPESSTLASLGGACCTFRLDIARHPFYRSKLNCSEPLGIGGDRSKESPVGSDSGGAAGGQTFCFCPRQ